MNTCKIWQGGKTKAGYGQKWHQGKLRYAHRIVAQEKYGNIDGMVVRHTCDNPSCVNPDHLLIGTHADNVNDRKLRNRTYRGGANNPHRALKILDSQIDEIKSLYQQGWTQTALGEKYGVHQTTIRSVVLDLRRVKTQ